MDLMDLLRSAEANSSLDQIADVVGIDGSQSQDLVSALAPALMRSIQKQTESNNGLEALQSALASGNHQQYVDQPKLMQSASTRNDGNKILGHLFGSKDVSRNVAAQAAADTGIDPALIRKALPLVASVAMGALSKKEPSGNNLRDLLGAIGGGNGVDVDDLLGMAKKLF